MFQSLKRWVKNEAVQSKQQSPPLGMQLMKGDLQRKFAKGVQYNMKIVIRGDRNTGKTCLWNRLKGGKFTEEYMPTSEIQVASIHWDYKATDDVVKVDVWDIVDQGRNKKQATNQLKITTDEPAKDILQQQVLDASFMDVYKNAHAAVFIFDITKKWTFKYIERELPKVPSHIPVLILANFRDMGDHRVISVDEVDALVDSVDRPPGSSSIMFYESSMKNGFGLKYIHRFFNMPFLLVQRESLLKQLKTNHLDLESCMEELSTTEHGYDEFVLRVQDAKKKGLTKLPPNSSKPSDRTNDTHEVTATSSYVYSESSTGATSNSQSRAEVDNETSSSFQPEVNTAKSDQKFFRGSIKQVHSTVHKEQTRNRGENRLNVVEPGPVANVDEFVPDAGPVDGFLNERLDSKEKTVAAAMDSSDDDENDGNPMVTGFQEDLDSDDCYKPSFNDVAYSSSDSEPDAYQSIKKSQMNELKLSQKVFSEVGLCSMQDEQQLQAKINDIQEPEILHGMDVSVNNELDLISGSNVNFCESNILNHSETKQEWSDSDNERTNALVSVTYEDIYSNDEVTSQRMVGEAARVQGEHETNESTSKSHRSKNSDRMSDKEKIRKPRRKHKKHRTKDSAEKQYQKS